MINGQNAGNLFENLQTLRLDNCKTWWKTDTYDFKGEENFEILCNLIVSCEQLKLLGLENN